MALRDWEEIVDEPFPDLRPITKRARELMDEHRCRYRSSARLANAHVWEDEAYEAFRREEFETPLP